MAKKLGLCLGAGGARGVAHLGFIAALEENNIIPDIITGCSMGAVVGGAYASGVTTKKLKKILLHLTNSELFDLSVGRLKEGSILAGKKFHSLLEEHLAAREFENAPIPFGCTATDLRSGKLISMTEGCLVTAIQASASLPMIFPPVERGSHLLLDGGILERMPISLTKKLGADVIVAVDVLGDLAEYSGGKTVVDVGLRVLSVIDCHLSKRASKRGVDLYICPVLGDMNSFKIENLDFAFQKGYDSGCQAVPLIGELLR